MNHTIEELPILILYPHNRCNCRCVMCDIWKAAGIQEISAADLDRHARDIKALRVRWVVFSGGEPLMHTDLFALCRRLREFGIRLTVLTTGLLLARNSAAIVEHVDEVIVSLDGPPAVHDRIRRVPRAYEMLADGVRALQTLRPDFPVSGRCTVQRLNFSCLRETVDTAKTLGLRSISFLAVDVTSTAFNRPEGWPQEKRAEVGLDAADVRMLEQEIDALLRDRAADVASGFVREDAQKLRRIAARFRAQLGFAEPVSPPCNAPWVSAVIESDGVVRPCFFHAPIGQIGERGLSEVLNSPEAVEFRRNLDVAANPICRKCVCSLDYRPRPPDGAV